MRWFEQQRMAWIEETLQIFGFINRKHLIKKFEITAAQAALDFTKYQKLHPERMIYDASAKCYCATKPAEAGE